jgi:molybdopterin-containing oxidoreductase family iron-sulfur binding subunit
MMARYGLIIDVNRCTGCYACVVACKSENSTRPGVSWIRIQADEEGEYPEVSRRYTPLLCVQCREMPCAQACPSEAIFMGDDGIVQIQPEKCPCQDAYPCTKACPIDVLQINKGQTFYFPDYLNPFEKAAYESHRDGVVEKCTLCSHRINEGRLPACVQACPTRAIIFGDYDDANSALAQLTFSESAQFLREELKVNPSVLYMKD